MAEIKTSKAAPHVVIIGGGFGGLNAAQGLADAPVNVTLIDRNNYHLFQPLLYQVATAAVSAGEIASPIRSVLRRQKNVSVLMAEAREIDLANKRVLLHDDHASTDEIDTLDYDYLIVAAGATGTYFGHDEWAPLAPGLKTLEDAFDVRRRIFLAYELAEREPKNSTIRDEFLTFVVVGGGPTGVELAGAIAEIAQRTLAHDFRSIDPRSTRVILVQSGERILEGFSQESSDSAAKQLRARGVEIVFSRRVTGITPETVELGGETIRARTTFWTAGVQAVPLARALTGLKAPLDRAGRVPIEADLSVPDFPEAFVIGDMALFLHQKDKNGQPTNQPLPGVAPVAIQMGQHVAKNIVRSVRSQARQPFQYWDKGNMATIGRAAAVAETDKFKMSGLLAWLAWAFVHIMYLIGFYNRLVVMFRWAWSYLTYQRGSRLITNINQPPKVADAPKTTTEVDKVVAQIGQLPKA
jgi:NADH dehydrogenase